MSDVICDACRLPPPEPVELGPDGLVKGWYIRRIAGRTYTLCDCCGSIRHFRGGISAYLQCHLGVGEYAEFELDDVPGGGLHRQRLQGR